jgi:mannose-6-phosphate isomerase-like protein (cupin superfamily)
MSIEKVNIAEKLGLINDLWNPRIAGELNGQHVKLVKINGEFVWHKHDEEDELFLILKGDFVMELREGNIAVQPGEFIIIPKGVEHRPVANGEVEMMLFEPATTLNTGNVQNEFTKQQLQKI